MEPITNIILQLDKLFVNVFYESNKNIAKRV